jgi:sigma-E factor negative regulatory protein RseA
MSQIPLNDASNDDPRERLSSLLDGECDASSVEHACRAWRESADLRSTWHAYQLIGDVLRSDDLARPASRDAAFLAAVRTRLADEPVVFAPAALASRRRRHPWMGPAAAAAGFVAVAGVVAVMGLSRPDATDPATTLAAAPGGTPAVRPVAASVPAPEPEATIADRKLIRDAQLDRYLAAHKQFGGTSAVAVPGAVLRSSATVAPAR